MSFSTASRFVAGLAALAGVSIISAAQSGAQQPAPATLPGADAALVARARAIDRLARRLWPNTRRD